MDKALSSILTSHHKACDDEWHFVGSKDGDLKNYVATKSIFEWYKSTHVIHLAARVGGLYENLSHKANIFRNNMAINDNVLKCCYEYHVQKVISCLSTCIFPASVTYPITEEMLQDDVHIRPIKVHNGKTYD